MNLNGTDRCLECMKDKHGAQICPHCGRDEYAVDRSLPYLAFGIQLNDQYVIGAMLGHGGFGVTYLAWDLRLDTPVAIKEYLPRDLGTRSADGLSVSCYSGDAAEFFEYGRKKFLDEARILARFSEHPGIVSVFGFFEANGTAYMVMQYVDGVDLKGHLARIGGRVPLEIALGIMTHVLDALRVVHEAGLLHRDMSPDNIYVTRDGRIKILDFGAAKDATGSHSQSQALIRKPGYSPEEQYRTNGQQGPWTDIYGTAATLYRMLTGVTPPEALDRIAEDTLQAPSGLGASINPQCEVVLMKALSVRGPDRYQSVHEFQTALLGCRTSIPRRLWILVLMMLGLVGSGGLVWYNHSKQQDAGRALAERVVDREPELDRKGQATSTRLEHQLTGLQHHRPEKERPSAEDKSVRPAKEIKRSAEEKRGQHDSARTGSLRYYNVVNVSPDDVLNVRAGPSNDDAKINEIPPSATCVQYLDEYPRTTNKWVRVRYGNTVGWVNSRYIEVVMNGQFRVINVESWDVLNMRATPYYRSDKVGEIPPGGLCEAVSAVFQNTRKWILVEYNGVRGWVNSYYLSLGSQCR